MKYRNSGGINFLLGMYMSYVILKVISLHIHISINNRHTIKKLNLIIHLHKNIYPVQESTLHWAILFFFKWEENKYFLPNAYCFIYKSDLFNPNFLEHFSILFYIVLYSILFFFQSYFFDEQSKFLSLQFYCNKKFEHRFIYERKLK